jgi:pimeloyl-ACP methyl ester carboxylesterase
MSKPRASSVTRPIEVRNSYVLVAGTRLHWAEVDKTGGSVPLVLLHGLNDSHLTWKHIAAAFATDRRVLMPDLPGHGRSERPNAGYELAWHAHLIAEWLRAVGIERADVVGHSFGGGVAQMLLLECPERVRRLVLLSSGGLGRDVGLALRLASLPLAVERFGQPFMAHGTRLALRGLRDDADIAELSAINAERGTARAFARTVRDVIDWRGQRRLFLQRAHEIGRLPPILVCWGDRDRLIPMAHGKAFADRVEGAVFRLFAGSGHYIHHEQPDLFARVVRDFLDDPSVPETRLRTAVRPSGSDQPPMLRRLWNVVVRREISGVTAAPNAWALGRRPRVQ